MVSLQHHHVVDIYEHDIEMGGRVSAYLAEGLARGEAAIVIATGEHRGLLARGLADLGVDVEACRLEGRLLERDAGAMLDGFFSGGLLDGERFDATVGRLVRSAGRFGGVRAVGEMVQLLWMRGEVIGAIALESAWNQLAQGHAFMLHCCYRAESLQGDVDALAQVRELHSDVVSAPAAMSWMTCRDAQSFGAAATSPRAARAFVADLLRRWGLEALVDAASLIVSELSTNAVRHVGSPFEIVLSRRGAALRIAVRDLGSDVPIVVDPPLDEASGRGVRIVAAIAHDWGVEPEPSGKTVWADLVASPG